MGEGREWFLAALRAGLIPSFCIHRDPESGKGRETAQGAAQGSCREIPVPLHGNPNILRLRADPRGSCAWIVGCLWDRAGTSRDRGCGCGSCLLRLTDIPTLVEPTRDHGLLCNPTGAPLEQLSLWADFPGCFFQPVGEEGSPKRKESE